MKKLVVFDLDGTLLHTIPDMLNSINCMLDKYGYKRVNESEIRHFIGNGARNLVKKSIENSGVFLTESEIDERLKTYNEHYTSSNSPFTRLYDGIAEMLIELKKRGYVLAVITNKPQMTTDNVNEIYLKRFGFYKVIGSSDKIIKNEKRFI